MSFTPPKYVQKLRERDQDDLVAALRSLADQWNAEGKKMQEDHPPSADETSVRADVRARVLFSTAMELRQLLVNRGL